MDISVVLLIAGGGAFAICWLINYIPLESKVGGKKFSPRLMFCKLLGPFDAGLTIILICGAWIGLTSAVTGI